MKKKTIKQIKEEYGFRTLDEVPKCCMTCRYVCFLYQEACLKSYDMGETRDCFVLRDPNKTVCNKWVNR